MDNLAYLHQISEDSKTKATRGATPPLFSPLMKKFLIAAAILFVGIIITGVILSSTRTTPITFDQLNLRATNLSSSISTYQPRVKSTVLRASSTSLRTILTNVTTSIAPLVSKTADPSIAAIETEIQTNLNSTLEHAKLTGTLDRVYSTQMSYEVKRLMTLLSSLAAASTSAEITAFLTETYDSLDILLPTFTEYE